MIQDDVKIQALMIYYKHWGNEQNSKRKIIHGFTKLKKCVFEYTKTTIETAIKNYNIIDDEEDDEVVAGLEEHLDKLEKNPSSLCECLQKCFDDEPLFDDETVAELSYQNYIYFLDLLFEDYGYDVSSPKLPTDEDIINQKKNSLDYFCDMSDEAHDILYEDDFTEDHILSVEAIVALM